MVLKGTLHVQRRDGQFDVHAGQAIPVRRGACLQYSTPCEDGPEYVATCLPAFSHKRYNAMDRTTEQRSRSRLALALVGWLVLTFVAASSHASILDAKQVSIEFTNAVDATAKATWSTPDRVTVSTNGLGWDGEPAASRDGWIQTKPLAIGLSWRPTSAISVRVTIQPPPSEIVLNSGQRTTPDGGDVYVRYSPDMAHWSSWQVLQRGEPQSNQEKQGPGRHYSGMLRVPNADRDEYSRLLSEYAKQDVPWKSDEDAAVRWILERQPDFFVKHLPFIGYVEFRYEGGFYGGQRFRSLKADVSCGMSGLHAPPKDKDAYRDRDSKPWSFRADERDRNAGAPPPAQ